MDFLPFLLAIGAIGVVLIILRAVVLWYWKIDKMVDLLKKIEQNTRPKGMDGRNIDDRRDETKIYKKNRIV